MFARAVCYQISIILCLLLLVDTRLAEVFAQEVRLNQIQVIGSHNSYHIAPAEPVMALLDVVSPGARESLDYTHRPLAEQFSELGIRQIELDIFADPKGGLYASPWGEQLGGEDPPVRDPNGLLRRPGMKVLHVQDIDFRTTVLTFVEALRQVRAWSQAHQGHCPILILVEVKQDRSREELTKPHPFGAQELATIDAEILSVFKPGEILKPDDVRGQRETLRDAIADQGWPLLDKVRGKVMFALDNTGPERELYLKDHPALEGRMMFASVDQDHPAAAFMKLNDVLAEFEHIQQMVSAGFLVRTRADVGTKEARSNDPNRRDKALASGAQFISTDYPEPDERLSDYRVGFPKGIVARGNPVTGKPAWLDCEFDKVK